MSPIILNFHGVGPVTRRIDDDERNCWLDQDTFEEVLDLAQGESRVQLTFDDGNSSDVEIVLPALLRRGLQATFFICSGRLDQPTFLSRTQVRELQAHGMCIGSHGVAHLRGAICLRLGFVKNSKAVGGLSNRSAAIPVGAAACPFRRL